VDTVGRDNVAVTPTGAAFLLPSVRRGILPDILHALMAARAVTRASLRAAQDQLQSLVQGDSSVSSSAGGAPTHTDNAPSDRSIDTATLMAQIAVLDGRQKALKLAANALYGFTGTHACLRWIVTCIAYT
jgi:DNA polymerase delta subunit 1